jgi:hypothetical protein
MLYFSGLFGPGRELGPTALGTFKRGKNLGCYVYNVTKSLRLLYTVDRAANTVLIVALGDRKKFTTRIEVILPRMRTHAFYSRPSFSSLA